MKLQILITVLICSVFMNTFSQNINAPEITQKESFAYLLKIFNKNPDEKVCSGKISEYNRSNKHEYGFYIENTWTKIYAKSQYYYEYKQTFNDEFKFPDLLERTNKEINTAINNINFNKKFSIIISGQVKDYDFTNERFPVDFDIKSSCLFKEIINDYKTDCFIDINSFNKTDFMEQYTEYSKFDKKNMVYFKPPYFNIKKEQASKFISERKNTNGYVDRNVYLKLEYSITNTKIDKNYYQSFFGCPTNVIINVSRIEVWADKYCVTKKLGEIKKINNFVNNNKYYNESNEQIYSSPEIYDRTEVMPSYKGGIDELFKFISENLYFL